MKPHDIACFGAVPTPNGWQSVCPHQARPDYGTIRWSDRALLRHVQGVVDAVKLERE